MEKAIDHEQARLDRAQERSMIYSEAKPGRVFVIRLEHGDLVHEVLETFARKEGVGAASIIALGGADKGSTLVVGPLEGRASPVIPKTTVLDNVHEVVGTGTLFPNEKGEPVLHMHLACGRGMATTTGCIRKGVRVWQVMEVIVQELLQTQATRRFDPGTGFDLLVP